MWGKILSSVSNALDFNQATLSGCIDIICVPQDALNTLKSTPFHVRFGKTKLLRSRETVVNIAVNGKPTELKMKLGAAGEAYFVEETEEDFDKILEVSPIASPISSPVSPSEVPELAPLLKLEENGTDPPPLQGISSSRATDFQSANYPSFKEDIPKYPEWSWKWGDFPKKRQFNDLDYTSGDEIGSQTTREREPDFANELMSVSGDEENGLTFSLCGHLLSSNDAIRDHDVFNANLITHEMTENDPLLWYHSSLVGRFHGRPPYYPARVILPLIASWVAFNRPISLLCIEKLINTNLTASDQKDRSWRSWFAGSQNAPLNEPPNTKDKVPIRTSASVVLPLAVEDSVVAPPISCASLPNDMPRKRYRKSLRPTASQLNALNLEPGANSITFSVTSSLQGTKSVSSTIYLWPRDAKIVVSDVDGTITRSDVLGQLMPIVGRDWSHAGVAEFYTKIRQNGYYILYLTARAIGQADSTRDYLFRLTQNEKEKLPDGPLILSPDRLFPSLKREVIDRKPYVFKIAALRDIRHLFNTQHSPFYAGFGNRDSDHRAYVFIGIPESKVFIIDPRGIIHHVNTTYAKTYETLSEVAEHMFPPIPRSSEGDFYENDLFNSFNYWRETYEYHIVSLDSENEAETQSYVEV